MHVIFADISCKLFLSNIYTELNSLVERGAAVGEGDVGLSGQALLAVLSFLGVRTLPSSALTR